MEIILASSSPRRHELLENAGVKHTVMKFSADETLPEDIEPQEAVMILSKRKMEAALKSGEIPDERVIITADTIVYKDGKILGKPKDAAEAREMLEMLSGTTHSVYTGFTVTNRNVTYTLYGTTEVAMRRIKSDEIDEYIASGEPFDKAGGYAIQGIASKFIRYVWGDYSTIVGLPLCEAIMHMRALGGDC